MKPDRFDVLKAVGGRDRLPAIARLAPGANVIGPSAIKLPEVVADIMAGGAPGPAAKLKLSVSRKLNVWADGALFVRVPVALAIPPKDMLTDVSVSMKPGNAPFVNLSKMRTALEKSVAKGPNVTVSRQVPGPITLPAVQTRAALAVFGAVMKLVAKTMALSALISEVFMFFPCRRIRATTSAGTVASALGLDDPLRFDL